MMISIVTVSRNRTEHLDISVLQASKSHYHHEHIVIDWCSDVPIRPNRFDYDRRVKVIRVESQGWWLTKAYNFGFSNATGTHILKMDADVIIDPLIFNDLNKKNDCVFTTVNIFGGSDQHNGLSGLFLCKRSTFFESDGFNEYIKGYGWDEIDLFRRIWSRKNVPFQKIRLHDTREIVHDDSLRTGSWSFFSDLDLIITNSINMNLSVVLPWDGSMMSKYNEVKPGHFKQYSSPAIYNMPPLVSILFLIKVTMSVVSVLVKRKRYLYIAFSMILPMYVTYSLRTHPLIRLFSNG